MVRVLRSRRRATGHVEWISAQVACVSADSRAVRSTLSRLHQSGGRGGDMATVYTIGYEGTDVDQFVDTLKAAGIEVLVDVRALPLSRKKGFSKKGLATRLDQEGVAYFHLVALGNPKSGRDAARGGQLAEFKQIYARHLLNESAAKAMITVEALARGMAVCLMCFERDPATCHRSVIADGLRATGFSVLHLFGNDPSRYVSDATKFPRRNLSKGATAA